MANGDKKDFNTMLNDIAGGRNGNECIDIDPIYLHKLRKNIGT